LYAAVIFEEPVRQSAIPCPVNSNRCAWS
jgi:hypothetical protein